jgi:protein TonB
MNGSPDAPVTIGIARQNPTDQQDRLATTLCLATVLHGMLIAGVTFGIEDGSGVAPRLEVVRSPDREPDEPRDDPASYLARTSQRGSGTTLERVPAEPPSAAAAGAVERADARDGSAGATDGSAEALLASSAARLEVRLVAVTPGDAPSVGAAGEIALPSVLGSTGYMTPRLTALAPAETDGFVPDTRSAVFAPYLDEWRRKVERLGTLNYPGLARRLDTRVSPVLAVELGADGRLLRVSIERSSGQADVDQAALELLRLASPFDPFPREMARQYPRLRFAYEWRFDRGAAGSGDADGAAAYSRP